MNDKMLKKHINECLKRICTIKGFMSDKDTDKYGCEENISILKSAIEACKKQIPKKTAEKTADKDIGIGRVVFKAGTKVHYCPECGRPVTGSQHFCCNCGQALIW